MSSQAPSLSARLGLVVALVILFQGSYWAFSRGGGDFNVFFESWRLVLQGREADVYRATPDRFLYAPGFAILLSPIAWIPRDIALGLWCAIKAGALIYALVRALGWNSIWAVVILARPVLIDFQYGQVNTLILAVALWALRRGTSVSWGALTIAALSKLFPLPLLGVALVTGSKQARIRHVLVIAATLAVFLALPLAITGVDVSVQLYKDWWGALVSRGIPLESHNQSFAALLHHWFGGKPTHIVALYAGRDYTIMKWSQELIDTLSRIWMLGGIAGLLYLIFIKRPRDAAWMAALILGVVVPSHLVWKPYLIFAIPAVGVLITRKAWIALVFVFAAVNLTSFDVIGLEAAARLEASALFLWVMLALGALVLWRSRANGVA